MKQLLPLFVIVITLFAIGCQETDLTGPVSASHNPMLKPSPSSGVVILKGDVAAFAIGGGSQPVFHVSGLARYDYAIHGQDEEQYIEFSINTQAQLTPVSPILATGTVDNQWIYQISTVGKTGTVLVEKSYYVTELGTKFHIIFAIDENNRLSVDSMWLDQLGAGTGS